MIALASGVLITMVTQSLIPKANRAGEPRLAGILLVGAVALYALLSFTIP